MHRDVRAAGERRECRVEAAVVEHGGVDAARQLAQLGDRGLGGGVGLGEQRLRLFRVLVDLLLREPERHTYRHEAGLHPVVEVALDAGALDVGGADGTGALLGRLPGLCRQLIVAGAGGEDRDAERTAAHAITSAATPQMGPVAAGTSMPRT